MTHRSTIDHPRPHRRGHRRRGVRGRRGRRARRDRARSSTTRSRRGSSARTPSPSSAAGSSRDRRPTTSCATGGSGSWPAPCVDTAIWDAVGKALGQPLWRLWGGYRDRLPMISIGGYYGTGDRASPRRSPSCSEHGLAGMKFKVGGLSPEEDAARFREAREAARRRLHPHGRRQPGLDRRRGDPLRAPRRGLRPRAGSRSRAAGATTAARCATCAIGAAVRVCAGQSEFSAGGCRDLMVEGAIDVCNFDASWSGGPTEWRRVAAMAHGVRRRRWATTRSRRSQRTCSRRCRTGRSWSASIRIATRSGGTS